MNVSGSFVDRNRFVHDGWAFRGVSLQT